MPGNRLFLGVQQKSLVFAAGSSPALIKFIINSYGQPVRNIFNRGQIVSMYVLFFTKQLKLKKIYAQNKKHNLSQSLAFLGDIHVFTKTIVLNLVIRICKYKPTGTKQSSNQYSTHATTRQSSVIIIIIRLLKLINTTTPYTVIVLDKAGILENSPLL